MKNVMIEFELPTDACAKCMQFEPFAKWMLREADDGDVWKYTKSCQKATSCESILELNGVRVGK